MSPSTLTGAPRALLRQEIVDAFTPSTLGRSGLRMGVEVELIPVRVEDGARVPIAVDPPGSGPDGVGLLEAAGAGRGWIRRRHPNGTACFDVPGVGTFTFEPGGQIELSTEPADSVDAVVGLLERALRPLHQVASDAGVELWWRGVDRLRPEPAPLLIDTPRYRKQSAHYDRIGPWGRRMMCDTAALHVNLDLGGRAVRRWVVANRAAPYLTALFANSPGMVDGAEVRSERAGLWRRLDPSRTGAMDDDADPAGAYLRFALDAVDFLTPPEGAVPEPFHRGWSSGATVHDWRAHLTTLFPEVRPRGYLELRSFDALRPAWHAAPLVVAVGLLYDPAALCEAERMLEPVDEQSLVRAGRAGLADARIRDAGSRLFDLALEGAGRLGEHVGGASLERARAFGARFVSRGLDPGGEGPAADPFEV